MVNTPGGFVNWVKLLIHRVSLLGPKGFEYHMVAAAVEGSTGTERLWEPLSIVGLHGITVEGSGHNTHCYSAN